MHKTYIAGYVCYAVRTAGLFHEIQTDSLTEIDYSFPNKLGQATKMNASVFPHYSDWKSYQRRQSIYLWKSCLKMERLASSWNATCLLWLIRLVLIPGEEYFVAMWKSLICRWRLLCGAVRVRRDHVSISGIIGNYITSVFVPAACPCFGHIVYKINHCCLVA